MRFTAKPELSNIVRTSEGRYSLWKGSSPGHVLERNRSFQMNEWHGTLTGIAARMRFWCLWVRIPPVLLPCLDRLRPVV